MSLMAKKGGDYELTPEGAHIARCYKLIDLGTQYNEVYSKHEKKVIIGWELPATLMSDGRPFSIMRRYTLSLGKKAALRAHLESWRGKQFTEEEFKGFDLHKILGATCLISIVHNSTGENTYANISAIMSLPKGSEVPAAVNPPVVFVIPDDLEKFDWAGYNAMSEGLKETISKSLEFQAIKPGSNVPEKKNAPPETDDIIPF